VYTEWAAGVRARMAQYRPPPDVALVRLGADLLESLFATAPETVVVHGDANPTNFLSVQRQPWLWIDAKPMVGDQRTTLRRCLLRWPRSLQRWTFAPSYDAAARCWPTWLVSLWNG
jgi:streptomycin 6-kinase